LNPPITSSHEMEMWDALDCASWLLFLRSRFLNFAICEQAEKL